MKAAIVERAGRAPVYGDFPTPVVGEGEVRVSVTAAALSHVVRGRASGSHYSSGGQFPFVVGIDGTGRLDDGTRVFFYMPEAPQGSMAAETVVDARRCIPLPPDLDDVTAAAIAIPGVSSWAALTERAQLRQGETVLVNGATGAAGRLAVQIAKHLGAGKVIATGRNPESLAALPALGADVVVPLVEDDDALEQSLKGQFASGIDIVLDYLWGRSARIALIAAARAGAESVPVRFIAIGSAGGPEIALPGAVLRSSSIELKGSGLGSIAPAQFLGAIKALLAAATPAGLRIATRAVPLADIGSAWSRADDGFRTVLTP